MNRLSLSQRIGGGFVIAILLLLLVGGIGLVAIRQVTGITTVVVTTYATNLGMAQHLRAVAEQRFAVNRTSLLTADPALQAERNQLRDSFADLTRRLRGGLKTDRGLALLERVMQEDQIYRQFSDTYIDRRYAGEPLDRLLPGFKSEVVPANQAVREALTNLTEYENQLVRDGQARAALYSQVATGLMVGLAVLAAILAALMAASITRSIARQLGAAVLNLQSSSAELQSVASQQASSSAEEAAALAEISATLKELVASSRQIAESAQHVASLAEDTGTAVASGEETVRRGQEALAGIKRQMDTVANHMLDLGTKSQQIGGVLDIISELAEQTNILAINAGIESAAAGEAGRRFGAISEEIRKLADRVGAQARDTRRLIVDMRGAANTTVMATEDGVKAVEAGTRQFGDVAAVFHQIASQVDATTEAAREIELSTRQQATGVEQVTQATGNTAQAARQTEAATRQTLSTAGSLSALSRDLATLVKPNGHAPERERTEVPV